LRLLRDAESVGTDLLALPGAILNKAQVEAAAPADEADDRTLVVLARDESV
jgi:hypothetical protein